MNIYNYSQYSLAVPIDRGLTFNVESDFNLYLWSDQHFGAEECNYDLARQIVQLIEKDKKALVILGGDLTEAIPRGYKISERGQRTTPDVQIVETISQLNPIKDKILVIFKGNHNVESRGESVDSDFVVASQLQALYKTVPAVIQFHTKNGTVKIAGGHGKSGAKNGDLELERLQRIFPGCQIYFLGHNHMLYAKQSGSLVYDKDGKEDWEAAWFVRTGNCLNYAEYARYGVLPPQRSGCIMFEVRAGKIKRAVEITSDYFKDGSDGSRSNEIGTSSDVQESGDGRLPPVREDGGTDDSTAQLPLFLRDG